MRIKKKKQKRKEERKRKKPQKKGNNMSEGSYQPASNNELEKSYRQNRRKRKGGQWPVRVIKVDHVIIDSDNQIVPELEKEGGRIGGE